MARKSTYKPLLLTTTVRNPERFRDMLFVLSKFKGLELTNELATKICGELIRFGLYKPTKALTDPIKDKWRSGIDLNDLEVSDLLRENPQEHKEAGFDAGWPSRFDTQFKLGHFFGFIYYKIGEPIEFSELGDLYIQRTEYNGDSFYTNDEQQVFLNAFVNYHRKNPYQKVLNHNKPLVLLLGVLEELSKDTELGSAGLFVHELPFLLVCKDNDPVALAAEIINFRRVHRFNPSMETVFDAVGKYFGGWVLTKDKFETITKEYPDDLLRKFRLTGLFSLRGNGSVIAINNDLREIAIYILQNHNDLQEFSSEKEYFKYASRVDKHLITKAKPKTVTDSDFEQTLLSKWVGEISVQTIKDELLLLSRGKESKHPVLRVCPRPLRLEFLCSLLLKSRNPAATIVANYSRDDEGLPISHAPGNNPDIEVHDKDLLDLYEVTLTTGAAQAKAEFAPITRHLEDKIALGQYKKENIQTIMVAPAIHADFTTWIEFAKFKDAKRMAALSISEFVSVS